MPPRVSVNLCCYNAEKYLEETLETIGAQTYKDWELVIVNDGSKDSTDDIVRRFIARGWPIRYVVQENQGLARARNKCLELSSGEFVAFIDQDDLWLPGKTERQVRLLDSDAGLGLVFSDALAFYQGTGRSYRYLRRPPGRGRIFAEQLRFYTVNVQTVMVRREALESYGRGFDPELRLAEDMDMFLRILHRWRGDYVPEVLVKYRIHGEMASLRHAEDWPREMRHIHDKLLRLLPGLASEHGEALDAFRAKIALRTAVAALERGDGRAARRALAPHCTRDARYGLAYLSTFFPSPAYHTLHYLYRRYVA